MSQFNRQYLTGAEKKLGKSKKA